MLTQAIYGKDNVRVLKVKKNPQNPNYQDVIELRVCVLLEGDIDESYTKADNASIVPTDTVKNTIHILAKQTEVWPIELFGATLTNHFVTKYSHIHAAHASITQYRWTRYEVDGKLHPHSFIQDGAETRVVHVVKRDTAGSAFSINSGIKGLTVLKSTGSMFYGYNKDDFTTLKETTDRILSTDVDASWLWAAKTVPTLAAVEKLASSGVFDDAYTKARAITLRTFALENSASVQATMYNMANQILAATTHVESVHYELPNKHYFNIDLSWHHGLKNLGKDAEVYAPQSDPNGFIKCTVDRTKSKL
ncbi:uricase [Sugiyamaella lignohabitans]|uniref:Uricase n=1 Tax=Sugiyamaella lignohabitans TaxID=796027 RepID=A0A161HMG7_9ASCO|nr:uricase [Sugiyamaella lignohabitans]ANB14907.1 uricase [Sugiyamaella lignohabitans]